jgi:quercetin dioxygenase-like cupin family protein
MADDVDRGGEAACWVGAVTADGVDGRPLVEHDLDAVAGDGGAVWSLPHGGDLDANLVRLQPSQRIDEHGNDVVDVLMVVRAGYGELVVDGVRHQLATASVALVPKGSRRTITAGADGLTYLTVHRRRGPLTIGRPGPSTDG